MYQKYDLKWKNQEVRIKRQEVKNQEVKNQDRTVGCGIADFIFHHRHTFLALDFLILDPPNT